RPGSGRNAPLVLPLLFSSELKIESVSRKSSWLFWNPETKGGIPILYSTLKASMTRAGGLQQTPLLPPINQQSRRDSSPSASSGFGVSEEAGCSPHIDFTGIIVKASTRPISFWRNGSAYFTPASIP